MLPTTHRRRDTRDRRREVTLDHPGLDAQHAKPEPAKPRIAKSIRIAPRATASTAVVAN